MVNRLRYSDILILAVLILVPVLAYGANDVLSPPIITTLSDNVSNEEIFYIGGNTEEPKIDVVIYLQNTLTGETSTYNVGSNLRGEWFYRHSSFLDPGSYILWSQTRLGNEMSPPSPQYEMTVQQTALQIGSSRISSEDFYLTSTIILLLALISLAFFIVFHFYHGHKKRRHLHQELADIERALNQGFQLLEKDIEVELRDSNSPKSKKKERELLKDLAYVKNQLRKELKSVEE